MDIKITASAAFPLMTERLLLREFVPADATAMAAFALDPDFWRHTSLTCTTMDDLKAFVEGVLAEQRQKTDRLFYNIAVSERKTGTLVGFVKTGLISPQDKVGMLGYALGSSFAGKGYATEAAQALIPFAFLALGYARLSASCDATNPASSRVLEKLGFHYEGCVRSARLIDGERVDSLTYGLLADEFLDHY